MLPSSARPAAAPPFLKCPVAGMAEVELMTIDMPIPMPAGVSIRFDGQVIIVTGAGRGLGAAYARLLAARGGAVVVHDAGVAQDGSGFNASVADAVASEITAAGGIAAACYENLEDPAG